jgi:hypothetical protein
MVARQGVLPQSADTKVDKLRYNTHGTHILS